MAGIVIKDEDMFHVQDALSLNCQWYMFVGARGIGKTFSCIRFCLQKFLKEGKETIVIRRWKQEAEETRRQYFDNIAEFFPKFLFRVEGKFGYVAAKPEKDENGKLKRPQWKRCVTFLDLNTISATKSISYNNVDYIIYDEFLPDDNRYLRNEPRILLNFYLTVDRYHDRVRLFMVSNAVKIANPFFAQYNVRMFDDGKVHTYNNGFLGVQFPQKKGFQEAAKKTRLGQFIEAVDPEYADYAINNNFYDEDVNGIRQIDKKKLDYMFTVHCKAGILHLSSYSADDGRRLIHVSGYHPAELKEYTSIANQGHRWPLIVRSDDIVRRIKLMYFQQKVTYEDYQYRGLFQQYMVEVI